jgi:hypothetical protein
MIIEISLERPPYDERRVTTTKTTERTGERDVRICVRAFAKMPTSESVIVSCHFHHVTFNNGYHPPLPRTA